MSSNPLPAQCDVLVVGGGINGAGIARDLAGRGWSVVLCERDDLASHTSSASTKLIHGGLRYLEQGDVLLVRKSLQERERLLRAAPHIIRPLRFVMPHDPALRPAWQIRLGLFLYDHLSRRELLPGSRTLDLRSHPAGAALRPGFARGFAFSDAWVDDARLVVLAALDARERGAHVLTRTACTQARRGRAAWDCSLLASAGCRSALQARVLVNATGPWAETFLRDVARPRAGETLATRRPRLVRGSHIVVPRRSDHAYLLQTDDRRVVFALPYEEAYTLIGTTEVEVPGPGPAMAGEGEIAYLCEQAGRYLAVPPRPEEVVWSYAGLRPLIGREARAAGPPRDGTARAATRDYLLEAEPGEGAPLLSVWGGKITTFRRLAEQAADRIGLLLGERRPAWTACAVLPGGELAAAAPAWPGEDTFERFLGELQRRRPWLGPAMASRLARAYGARVEALLGGATSLAELGPELAPGLHEAELEYLMRNEWALTADDVLWRRSKRGLHCSPAQRAAVAAWMHERVAGG